MRCSSRLRKSLNPVFLHGFFPVSECSSEVLILPLGGVKAGSSPDFLGMHPLRPQLERTFLELVGVVHGAFGAVEHARVPP